MRLTRRGLLRRGGAGAAAGAALGAGLSVPRRAAARPGDERSRHALLIVLPLVRATHVNAFDGDSPADTPNLDALADESLRFDRAIPESMPALPVRRALLTGTRSYPFRDWRRTEGMPRVPGFNPIWDHQPVVTETMRADGVTTAYVSDNPVLRTRRFPELRTTTEVVATRRTEPGIETDLLRAFDRAGAATGRTFRSAIVTVRELRRERRLFLGVDPLSPTDAYTAPPVYVRPGEVERESLGRMDGRLVALDFDDGDVERVRERYVEHVERVDRWLGRLLDALDGAGLADDTAVVAIGDQGVALGEHDYLGIAAPSSHRQSYEIPLLVRHPEREEAGDDVDWYASTHDVAPTLLAFMGVGIPGKMCGEDLTALFDDVDEDDLPDRPRSVTAVGSMIVVRDNRWLMLADRQKQERRLYDDDEEAEDDIKRYDDVANEEPGVLSDLSLTATLVAGGTLPEFGPDGALRPGLEQGDDDRDDDGIPNDFDVVDDDEPGDGVEPEDRRFDGRRP